MTLALAIFDMAGTTVYDGDAVHRQLAAALGRFGVEATRDELNAVMGFPKPVAIRAILESRLPPGKTITDEAVGAAHLIFLDGIADHYRSDPDVREVPGASETFRHLRAGGAKIALDTGFSRETAQSVLERLDWVTKGLIDATVTSDEVPHGRPWPDMIYKAMAMTEVSDLRRVAKIGDTPSDLQEGTAAGCGWVIGVTSGSHTAEELRQYPHTHLIDSVADLCRLFPDPVPALPAR